MSNELDLTAVVSPRSKGGVSLFETLEPVSDKNVDEFCSTVSDIEDAARELRKLGFTVMETSAATISIQGSKKLFQEVFGTRLKKDSKDVFAGQKEAFYEVSGDAPQLLQAPGDLGNLLEGVALSQPPEFFESALAPIAPVDPAAYRYLFLENDVAILLRATRTHRTGGTGLGIKVGMPDTGFYRHPYYIENGYRTNVALLGAGAVDAAKDGYGHGTGEAANIFAVAPDARLVPVKMGDTIDSFKKAVAAGAKVITNSWGYNVDKGSITWATLHPYLKALAQEIQLAINNGVVVCFSAGNGHYGFPASMPKVIAVGGVHVNHPGLTFEASNYASSFVSKIFPGRRVPDVCGLTGKRATISGNVRAPLLMLPVQPDSILDKISPTTGATDDGWGIFSGTSAACPQVAGVVALMLHKNPALTPAQVKTHLINTARDVKTGTTAMGDTAAPGNDLATGAGVVDAKWAYLVAMGGAVAKFFEASPQMQTEMIASGALPQVPPEFVSDLIETLRSV